MQASTLAVIMFSLIPLASDDGVRYFPVSLYNEKLYDYERSQTPGRVELTYASISAMEKNEQAAPGFNMARSILKSISEDAPANYSINLCNSTASVGGYPYYWTYLRMLFSNGENELLGAFRFTKETHFVLGHGTQYCTVLPISNTMRGGGPCFHPEIRGSLPQRYLYDLLPGCTVPGESSPPSDHALIVPWRIGPDNDLVPVHIPIISDPEAKDIALSTAQTCRRLAALTNKIAFLGESDRSTMFKSELTPDSASAYELISRGAGSTYLGTNDQKPLAESLEKQAGIIERSVSNASVLVLNLRPVHIVIPLEKSRVLQCRDVMVSDSTRGDTRSIIDLWGTTLVLSMVISGDDGARLYGIPRAALNHLLAMPEFSEACSHIAQTDSLGK